MIERFAALVPSTLRNVSGSVFYSGRAAFSGRPDVYIIGANPGGDPLRQHDETVQWHSDFVLKNAPERWSAYCDETWEAWPSGQAPLQRRIQHLLSRLGLNPRLVPASNLVFSRSRRLEHLDGDFNQLADLCWRFHDAVIQTLEPKAVICLGAATGKDVARRTGAGTCIGRFSETNNRRWTSLAWQNPSGLIVFGLTHPAIADWTNPDTDPTPMVMAALAVNKN